MATYSGNRRSSYSLFSRSRRDSSSKCSVQNSRLLEEIPPDKELEQKVLQVRFEYLSTNLPPDDVSIEMQSKDLLTIKEYEEYVSMKRAHTSDSTKSEYLLQCLGRRKAGFLTQFCEILKGIKQTSYLADDIVQTYKQIQKAPTSGLKSRSHVSRSDPDLLSTKNTQSAYMYYTHECTRCKALERQNKKLEKQNRRLVKQQEAYQNIVPLKLLAEVIQEQVGGALTGCDKLKQLLPSMQEAATQAACQFSGAKTSLKKMNDIFAKMSLEDHTERDSMLSDSGAIVQEVEVVQVDQYAQPHQHRATAYQSEVKMTDKEPPGTRKQPLAGDPQTSDNELSLILKKRREKVEATSTTH